MAGMDNKNNYGNDGAESHEQVRILLHELMNIGQGLFVLASTRRVAYLLTLPPMTTIRPWVLTINRQLSPSTDGIQLL